MSEPQQVVDAVLAPNDPPALIVYAGVAAAAAGASGETNPKDSED
jgi:hypothetical protein